MYFCHKCCYYVATSVITAIPLINVRLLQSLIWNGSQQYCSFASVFFFFKWAVVMNDCKGPMDTRMHTPSNGLSVACVPAASLSAAAGLKYEERCA